MTAMTALAMTAVIMMLMTTTVVVTPTVIIPVAVRTPLIVIPARFVAATVVISTAQVISITHIGSWKCAVVADTCSRVSPALGIDWNNAGSNGRPCENKGKNWQCDFHSEMSFVFKNGLNMTDGEDQSRPVTSRMMRMMTMRLAPPPKRWLPERKP